LSPTFREKLAAAVRRNDSRLCVGLDPDHERTAKDDVLALNRAVIEATADLVCCYKPNIAFYEALGAEGAEILRATLRCIPTGIPVLLDAKRGDIGHTASAYAQALFDGYQADAVTVNPYLGEDALEPFLSRADRGVFIVCRTSNPGARDLQDLQVATESGHESLFLTVARLAAEWNRSGNAGLVVGATYPEELVQVRKLCPDMPILIPGVGSQGGALDASVRAADNGRPDGFLLSVSRGVMYAGGAANPADAARREAQRLRDAINRELGAQRQR
jgi:orotidine-5'-phosphate decarboxylase